MFCHFVTILLSNVALERRNTRSSLTAADRAQMLPNDLRPGHGRRLLGRSKAPLRSNIGGLER
eukprot:9867843-Heterocapsa_arctica.AAC.1